MLTEVKAYSSWRSAPTLPLNPSGRAETDLIQIRDIQGLDPVKASVTTSQYGAIDGASFTGSSVDTRNIVLTIRPNPDWQTWTYEKLRRLIYSYFMPKRLTRLVFYSDDLIPLTISGIVEDVSINMFSKDPEFTVSIICPDPYFTALDPTVITGITGDDPVDIEYNGSVEAGINLKVSWTSGTVPTNIAIPNFSVDATVNNLLYFEMGSVPMRKFVQNIDMNDGSIKSLLDDIAEGSTWPILEIGTNSFFVETDHGVQDWELTYYERFGGL